MDPHEFASVKAVVMSTVEPVLHLRVEDSRLRFEDSKTLGAGGFGVVKSAILVSSGLLDGEQRRRVAVKEIRPSHEAGFTIKRFSRELKVWSLLRHKNILPLIGFDMSNDLQRCRLICPWMPLGNIKTLIEDPETTLECRAGLANDALEGLIYLHSLEVPVIHGDLKAENVLLDKNRGVLCDFGLATLLHERFDDSGGLTTGGGFKGTVRWSSPEMLNEERPSIGSDIWSWGMLCLEIMSGKIPYFQITNWVNVAAAIIGNVLPSEKKEDYGELPPWSLLEKCWRVSAAERPDANACSQTFHGLFTKELGGRDKSPSKYRFPETFPEVCQLSGCTHLIRSPYGFAAHETLHFRNDRHVCYLCTAQFPNAGKLLVHLNKRHLRHPLFNSYTAQRNYHMLAAPRMPHARGRMRSPIRISGPDTWPASLERFWIMDILPPPPPLADIIEFDAFLERLRHMRHGCRRYGLERMRNVISHLRDLGYVDLAQQLGAEFPETLELLLLPKTINRNLPGLSTNAQAASNVGPLADHSEPPHDPAQWESCLKDDHGKPFFKTLRGKSSSLIAVQWEPLPNTDQPKLLSQTIVGLGSSFVPTQWKPSLQPTDTDAAQTFPLYFI